MGIYFGPAGWSYDDWKGIVYPKGSKLDSLEYLSRFVDTVEINSSFYRIPNPKMSTGWVKKVEANPRFCFTVKLNQQFTHQRQYSQEDIHQMRASLEPLLNSDKLGTMLIQFPWSFKYSEENHKYIQKLTAHFSNNSSTIEVRHISWNNDAFYSTLIEKGIGFCNIDQPLFSKSLAPTEIHTSPVGYVRLHGQNYDQWFNQGATQNDRYNYLYSEEELSDWVSKIKALAPKVDSLFVIANNHFKGQALVNTFQLISNVTNTRSISIPPTLCASYPQLDSIYRKVENDVQGALF